jgi:hypothetical protein
MEKISDEWVIKISPAGWAFSIWGLIYALLGGFVYFQSKSSGQAEIDDDVVYGQVGKLFSINMLSNGLWLLLFN